MATPTRRFRWRWPLSDWLVPATAAAHRLANEVEAMPSPDDVIAELVS